MQDTLIFWNVWQMTDKYDEKIRYDLKAKELLKSDRHYSSNKFRELLSSPYLFYERNIICHCKKGSLILEICAGTGENTQALLDTDCNIVATDISNVSLQVLAMRFCEERVVVSQTDIENLAFRDDTFDLVCCAGGLSYGDNGLVMDEIYRVLKVDGSLVIIDSLNHNLIYRANRFIHYMRGRRSKSTLLRMPSLELIQRYRDKFGSCEATYFGAIVWALPLLKLLFGARRASAIIQWVDLTVGVKKSAFKFVMVARKTGCAND